MNKLRSWGAAVALSLPATAAAQSTGNDPANATSYAPALVYASAFAGYRPLGDDGVGRWREVNDRVREAAAERAGPAHAPPTAPVPKPAAATPTPPTGAKR